MKLPALARIPVLVLMLAGCTSAPGASPSPSVVVPTPAVPTPIVTPTATATSTPDAVSSSTPQPQGPPQAALGYSDFAVTGWLGTYCWQGLCADVFELPPKYQLPVVAAGGESLIFSMEDGEFAKWIVQYGPDGGPMTELSRGGESVDPDVASPAPAELLSFAEFDNPPSGDWLLTVQVFFVDGDATYGWHVIVE